MRRRLNRRCSNGRFTITGDYTGLKVWLSSAMLGLIILYLDWGKILPAEAEFISPLGDSKLIEIEKPVYIKTPVYELPPEIIDKVRVVFGKDADQAIRVFTCESHLNPKAQGTNTNGSTDTGVAQINSVHGISAKWLKNPDINLLVAKQIFNRSGWSPWTCARKLGIK